jgi:hypothetical protein
MQRSSKTLGRVDQKSHPVSQSSDREFDRILDAQRLADANPPAVERAFSPKRKLERLSDHAYRLRKERTANLMEGYRNVNLRRSQRLKDKLVPDDLEPAPPTLGRGKDPDSDDPDAPMTSVESRCLVDSQTMTRHLIRCLVDGLCLWGVILRTVFSSLL